MNCKTVLLKDLVLGEKGSYGIGAPAVDYDPKKYTYLRITDINDDGSINTNGLKSVDAEDAYKYILQENDIVFARTGASTGKTYFYQPQDGTLVYAGFLIKFSIDPRKVNPRLLKYITHSQEYYDWVRSFDTGGTRGNINAVTFANMPITLANRATQDKIVAILSSLDDKIELNRRINTNLEEQAQALYKSWFVDFEPFGGKLPEDWREGTLGEIADITMGQSPDGTSYNTDGKGVIFYQGSTDFGIRFPSIRQYTTSPKRIEKKGDILMSVRAPVGTLNIANNDCCIGRGLASLNSKRGSLTHLYYVLNDLKSHFDSANSSGTTFGSITKDELTGLCIIMPPASILEQFEKCCSSVFD